MRNGSWPDQQGDRQYQSDGGEGADNDKRDNREQTVVQQLCVEPDGSGVLRVSDESGSATY